MVVGSIATWAKIYIHIFRTILVLVFVFSLNKGNSLISYLENLFFLEKRETLSDMSLTFLLVVVESVKAKFNLKQ